MAAKQPHKWIVVRNWEKFQHYRDRSVPWIKFYTELLHDSRYLELPDTTRLILLELWLYYASARAQVPLNTALISRQLSIHRVTRAQLERLNQAGFIEFASRPNLEHVKNHSRPTRARVEVDPKGSTRRRARKRRAPDENDERGQANAAAPSQENGNTDPPLEPDPEGLKRLADILANAELNARQPATTEPTPEQTAEAARRQEASREWLRKNPQN